MARLKPYGPRGGMLLGFSVIAYAFGLSYTTKPESASQLFWLDSIIPIEYLGWVWFLVGVWLTVGAYRVDQSKALGAFAGLCSLWALAYGISVIINLTHDRPPSGYLLVPIFFGLTIACGSAVRMFNPARARVQVVVTPKQPTNDEE